MTSLALLPHATRAAAPPFNANFFIAAATVIPVLFLAIALQGRLYENLLKTFTEALSRAATPGHWHRTLLAIATAGAAAGAAAAVLSGAAAEILSVYALYQQQASASTAQSVLEGVTIMVIVTAAGPALAFGRVVLIAFVGAIWILAGLLHTDPQPEASEAEEAAIEPSSG